MFQTSLAGFDPVIIDRPKKPNEVKAEQDTRKSELGRNESQNTLRLCLRWIMQWKYAQSFFCRARVPVRYSELLETNWWSGGLCKDAEVKLRCEWDGGWWGRTRLKITPNWAPRYFNLKIWFMPCNASWSMLEVSVLDIGGVHSISIF